MDNFSAGPYLYSLIRPSFIHMYILVTPDFKLWGSLSCQRQPWQWNNLITVYDTCLCNIWTWCKKGNNSNCQPSNLSPVSLKCIPSLKLHVLHRTKKTHTTPPPQKKTILYYFECTFIIRVYCFTSFYTCHCESLKIRRIGEQDKAVANVNDWSWCMDKQVNNYDMLSLF